MARPPSVYGKLIGLDAFAARMGHLARDVAGPIARKAVDLGCRPILAYARGLAPERTGAYRRSLGYVVRTYHQSRITVGIVGVIRDYAEGARRPGRYASMVEHGRGPVTVKHKRVLSDGNTIFGTKVGPAAGQFVLRRAHDFGRPLALKAVADVLAFELARLKA